VKVYYRMASAFGWTPEQTQALTMAQAAILTDMLNDEDR